jgi:hypothetical protein
MPSGQLIVVYAGDCAVNNVDVSGNNIVKRYANNVNKWFAACL